MDRKTLFKRLAHLIFLIFILNFLANKFYWYVSIWYFDMIMHFLGGLWLGLFFIYILFLEKFNIKRILGVIALVFLIGVCWEIFELYFINHLAQNPFNLIDTTSDIFFDLAGGLVAILFISRGTLLSNENEVK